MIQTRILPSWLIVKNWNYLLEDLWHRRCLDENLRLGLNWLFHRACTIFMMCASRFVELHKAGKRCRPIVLSVFMDFRRIDPESKQWEQSLSWSARAGTHRLSGVLCQRFDYYSWTNCFCAMWIKLVFSAQEIASLSGGLWVGVLFINQGSSCDRALTSCNIKCFCCLQYVVVQTIFQ